MIRRKAILIIHGFAGGTYDIESLANSLEFEPGFDVYTFTLPGHDNIKGKVSYKEWVKSAENMMEMLIKYGYKNIYVIGHSMGGVIATYIASKYKQVKKLVLAAPAFHYLKCKGNDLEVLESLKVSKDIIKEYKADTLLTKLISLPRNAIVEFVKLVRELYDTPENITIPTLIIEGKKDSVVPRTSTEYVFKTIKSKYKILLKVDKTNHDIFKCSRKEEINKQVISFLKHKYFTKNSANKVEI